MGRIPCCEKDSVKRGQWTPEEDNKLSSYIAQHGTRNWRLIPKNAGNPPPNPIISPSSNSIYDYATPFSPFLYIYMYASNLYFCFPKRKGLQRCGKSCRLRWTNYLRPDLKHGQFSESEEQTIVKLHSVVGNRWSLIAAQLPGRTDNDVKNHWNTKLKKKLSGMGIDPVTHKPFSHLMAEIATTLAPPQVAHLAEAALGCFKDEMLHLLTKKRIDFQLQQSSTDAAGTSTATYIPSKHDEKDEDTIEKIKLGLSRAIQDPPPLLPLTKHNWDSNGGASSNFVSAFPASASGFQYDHAYLANEGEGSPWSQSICTGSTCTGGDHQERLLEKLEDDNEGSEGGKTIRNGSNMFSSDCVLWDLPSDDLMNPMV